MTMVGLVVDCNFISGHGIKCILLRVVSRDSRRCELLDSSPTAGGCWNFNREILNPIAACLAVLPQRHAFYAFHAAKVEHESACFGSMECSASAI